jgi:integrase
VKRSEADHDYIFSTTAGASPVSGWSKIKSRLDDQMQIPHWRLHDLRRTAATGMAEIGIAPHIVEAALNHVSGAKAGVAGVYNRAQYAAEKKMALSRWADHVLGIVNGDKSKVVQLRKA